MSELVPDMRGCAGGNRSDTVPFQPKVEINPDSLQIDDELWEMIRGKGSKWPVEPKVMAACYYAILGSYNAVATHMAAAGFPVPRTTLAQWRTGSKWWKPLMHQVRQAKQEEFDAAATRIIHKSLEKMYENIENGDAILDKDGNIQRIPMKAKDMALVMGVTYDKRALGRGDPTQRLVKEDSSKVLEDLAKRFLEMTDKPKPIEAVETEYAEFSERNGEPRGGY